jgi:hypothetical protein
VLNQGQAAKEHISAEIVRTLNAYRDHLNAQFGIPEAPIVPPAPDGKPWHITTRQFRRTVAWHIGNRPFGTVAGMIQYKHSGIGAYEGYAGSSRSGFRHEIERETGASLSSDRCVLTLLYNTTTERPRDRGASLSVASLGRMPGPYS